MQRTQHLKKMLPPPQFSIIFEIFYFLIYVKSIHNEQINLKEECFTHLLYTLTLSPKFVLCIFGYSIIDKVGNRYVFQKVVETRFLGRRAYAPGPPGGL